MIRLLAIDIDGTLLDGKGRLPDAHRDAVAAAAGRGIEIALVTGRAFHFCRPVAALLPVPVTLIVNNGALLKDRSGTTLIRRLLPREAARAILHHTRDYEDSVALFFDRADGREMVCHRMDWTQPNRRGYYERNKAFIVESREPLAEMLIEDPVQVAFNGSVLPMRTLAHALREGATAASCSVTITEYEQRDFSLVDVTCAGCSKGSTLAQWAASRGLAREHVMAIGDNLNDEDMLDFAGTAVVMGNAPAVLKTPGRLVTGSNDEGGLADAIRRLLLEPVRASDADP